MAELSKDTVFRLVLGDLDGSDRRILETLLARAQNIRAFAFADDGALIVSVSPAGGEGELVRALAATGVHPLRTDDMTKSYNGGMNAC